MRHSSFGVRLPSSVPISGCVAKHRKPSCNHLRRHPKLHAVRLEFRHLILETNVVPVRPVTFIVLLDDIGARPRPRADREVPFIRPGQCAHGIREGPLSRRHEIFAAESRCIQVRDVSRDHLMSFSVILEGSLELSDEIEHLTHDAEVQQHSIQQFPSAPLQPNGTWSNHIPVTRAQTVGGFDSDHWAERQGKSSTSASTLRGRAIKSFIETNYELAVLPKTAALALQMANDPSSDIGKIARLVRTDPAVAGRVIALSQSPAFSSGRGSKNPSIERAIVRMGVEPLKAIIIQVALNARIMKIREFEKELVQLQRHSIFAAAAAQSIARSLGLNAELSFIMGLLHDVGRSIGFEAFSRATPAVRNELVLEARGLGPLLDMVHEEIGAFAAGRWGLSEAAQESVRHHHEVPPRLESLQYPLLVKCADILAHQLGDPEGTAVVDLRQVDTPYRLGLQPYAIEEMLVAVPKEAEGLLALLS